MESLYQRFGPQAMVDIFTDLGAEYMPQHHAYEDESQNIKTFPSLDKEPEVTPEWGYQYLNAEI